MCGRYVSVRTDGELIDEFDVEEVVDDELEPSWNVAPTDPVRAVLQRKPHGTDKGTPEIRQLRTLRWGLVPSWSKDRKGGARMINARVETVTAKPAFKSAAGRRRCLLPSAGYYEWQTTPEAKTPYFLHDPDGRPLAMAGLYELWRDDALPDDDPNRWLWTCTVITRPATDLLGRIHDRTPVLVPPGLQADWLDCTDGSPEKAQRLLDALPEPHLEPYVVSARVNSVRNNGPDLIAPVGDEPEPQQLF